MFTCILILRYATDSFGSTKSFSVFPVNNFTRTSISPGRKLQAQNTPGASCPTGSFKKGRCRQNFTKAIGISPRVFRAQNQSISIPFPRGRLKILNRICQIQESFQMRPKASNPNFSLQICLFKIGLFTMIILGRNAGEKEQSHPIHKMLLFDYLENLQVSRKNWNLNFPNLI